LYAGVSYTRFFYAGMKQGKQLIYRSFSDRRLIHMDFQNNPANEIAEAGKGIKIKLSLHTNSTTQIDRKKEQHQSRRKRHPGRIGAERPKRAAGE
jgi:hypothetical protein